MGPWSVKFIHDLKSGQWGFEANHGNGSLRSESGESYASFDEAYQAAIPLFALPHKYYEAESPVKEWIEQNITIEEK